MALCDESIAIDPFNFGCMYVKAKTDPSGETYGQLIALLRDDSNDYNELALEFIEFGDYAAAIEILDLASESDGGFSMIQIYYRLYCLLHLKELGEHYGEILEKTRRDYKKTLRQNPRGGDNGIGLYGSF